MNCIPKQSTTKVMYNQIADIVESMIGAIFLAMGNDDDIMSSQCEKIILGLLEELKLPMKNVNDSETTERWFQASHSSLLNGFDFQSHPKWEEQLKEVSSILDFDLGVNSNRCESRVSDLIQKLESIGGLVCDDQLDSTRKMKILFSCALFDDDLSDFEDDMDDCPAIRLSRVRENLFFVGDSVLHLVLAVECYKRYPLASVGDLHLVRHCCIGDEVLAYLMVKFGIDNFLYSDHDTVHQMFQSLVSVSDEKGSNEWARKEGWILGEKEFIKRMPTFSTHADESNQDNLSPQYPGIAGGMLFGSKGTMGKLYTSDLAYAFKSIVGSMVLSIGVRGMWQVMLPIFDELLILSADEIRKHVNNNITNQPGKTAKTGPLLQKLRDNFGLGWSAS